MQVVNVIGGGIAGSIVARVLGNAGVPYRVFDDNDRLSGSRASSNLYIASWLKKFGRPEVTQGIEVLESLFRSDQIDHPFSTGIGDALKVRHIAQRHLLIKPDITEEVMITTVRRSDGEIEIQTKSGQTFNGPTVVCVGRKDPGVSCLVGHCLLIRGQVEKGSITMPTPYRHHKLYNFEKDVIYFANSTALQETSFNKRSQELRVKLLVDARKALGYGVNDDLPILEYRVGYRPIVDGHPFARLSKDPNAPLWNINGGGKNGMIAYAYQAKKFLEQYRQWTK